MLSNLLIQNVAIIDRLEVEFYDGLNILTGETGAGKSILIGALSLLLGNRADVSILKDKNRKCVVEGEFVSHNAELLNMLSENDVESDDNIILRREIAPGGKSRAFINDTPVSSKLLKDAGSLLVDIHSQHENLNLNDNLYQLSVIDVFAGLSEKLNLYGENYIRYKAVEKELSELKNNSLKVKAELDFLEFQYNELKDAKLSSSEQEEIESELQILNHAEEIKAGLYAALQELSAETTGAGTLLRSAEQSLSRIEKFHEPSVGLRKRIESTRIELKDIANELENSGNKAEIDPGRLEIIQDRLNILYSLQKKHHLKNTDELISLKELLKNKIDDLSSQEFRMEGLERERTELFSKITDLAHSISEGREAVFPVIRENVVSMLVQLGIPYAKFEIRNVKSSDPGIHGMDNIGFLFTANRKTELQDISKIASGGELSRLMLSIKSLVSGRNDLPTIIFDEIDAGVSGEIAYKVGRILKEMSSVRQIFAITHLPQVASKGDNHFLVFKQENESGTSTEIKLLNSDERIAEIAKMLSGEQTTEAAFANARELLR